MKTKLLLSIALCLMLSALLLFAPASRALADSNSINFESYTAGNINGQDGWTKTGSYDAAVVNNSYGYPSFGTQSLRISDSVTSGSFGDQTFAKPLINAVGESGATAGSYSVGTRQRHFETQFDLASTLPTLQSGMHVSVSPDRGDGSRMSYLRFEDQSDGIHVYFDDVTDPGPVGTVATFSDTDIATVSRSPHTVKLTMDMVDGPGNDVVKVYIDGTLKVTGTSWEDYYRYDPEAAAEQSPRIIKTVEFRESGTATPADAGKGFLIDNLSLSSSVPVTPSGTITVSPANMNGWFFSNDGQPTPVYGFSVGPATPPLGTGSVHFALSTAGAGGIIASPAFAGTPLASITHLQYSTYRSSVDPGNNLAIALQFDVDYDLTDTNLAWQGRLNFEPYQGPGNGGTVVQNTWQTWNPLAASARWWASGAPGNTLCPQNAPCSWNQVKANWPNAGLRTGNGMVNLKAGSNWAGFDGTADALTIGVSGTDATYNFEPVATPGLNFQPPSSGIAVGQSESVVIDLNSVANLYGYQFQVNFGSNVSATNPALFYNGFFDTTGAAIPTGWNAVCNSTSCKFAVSHVSPQTAVTGSGALAVINFTGVTPGTASLTFSNDLLSDIDGNPISHNVTAGSITVFGAATFSGTVTLQGRTTPITSGTVTLTDQSNFFPPTVVNFNASTGAFSASVPAKSAGDGGTTYTLLGAHGLYLGNQLTGQTVNSGSGTVNVASTKLKGGDANNDGTIDIADLTCIGGAFGGGAVVCGTTGSSDINADTFTNILDLVLAGGNYNLATPQPW